MTEPIISSQPVEQRPQRILIISHDVIGSRMAGTGIRYWEMARVLAAYQPVTLIAPQPSDLQPSVFRLGHYAWGDRNSLAGWLAEADLVIANGYILQPHPELATIAQPLALDLYDPILLENLELGRSAPLAERTTRTQEDVALLSRQLATGDFFLCATERQRDLYIGALMGAGRITPEQIDADPQLRQLIDVVPFGVATDPPSRAQSALRGVVPGIAVDDLILLWSGGLWDWLDPLTLIQAMPDVIAQQPTARLVFLAGAHPGNVAVMRRPDEARALAAELGVLNSHVFFYDQWVPYQRRADFLLDADIAVSLHHQHLETAYAAVRSRFLDHLWASLPSVVSDGDAAAVLVRQHDLGRVVPTNDPQALATALINLLERPDERAACAQRASALASRMTWDHCLPPLIRWSQASHSKESPMVSSDSRPAHEEAQPAMGFDDTVRNDVLASLDSHWQVSETSIAGGLLAPIRRFLIQHLVRPFVVPLLERQNAYNAAATKALYALADSSDQRRIVYQHQISSLEQREGASEQRLDVSEQRIGEAEREIREVWSTSAEHTRDILALEQHVLDLDDADTAIAEMIHTDRDQTAKSEPDR